MAHAWKSDGFNTFSYLIKGLFCIEKYREEGRQDIVINSMNQANQKTQRGRLEHINLCTRTRNKAQIRTHSRCHRTHFYNKIRTQVGISLCLRCTGWAQDSMQPALETRCETTRASDGQDQENQVKTKSQDQENQPKATPATSSTQDAESQTENDEVNQPRGAPATISSSIRPHGPLCTLQTRSRGRPFFLLKAFLCSP